MNMITIYYFFSFVFSSYLLFGVTCQRCGGASQYNECSTNKSCGCFESTSDSANGICAFLGLDCSQFSPCETVNNICQKSDHVCVRHPRCHDRPVCYPLRISQKFCPLITNSTATSQPNDNICARATWSQNATSVAGGYGQGSGLNQLNNPFGLFVDQNQSIYVADSRNSRVVKWIANATSGVVVGGNGGAGGGSNQLNNPQDIVVDNNGTIYITDTMNARIQQSFNGGAQGQTFINGISSIGITQDNQGSIYVAEWLKGQISKWYINGTLQQVIISNLSFPNNLFVDKNQSIYVADTSADRVIKIDSQTKNVSIVAGGSPGGNLSQLSGPEGVAVDQLGNVYVADSQNHRIVQWPPGAASGTVIAGNQTAGSAPNQLYYPSDLSFDSEGNLYVVDNGNHRVQKFLINKNLC